jgi:hypothetical protein
VERVAFDGSQPSRPVGHYTYIVADGSWTWSEGVYAMHGYAPREVPATTEVLLHHKHPDDRDRTFAVLESAVANGEPFSCYHRVIDRNQRVRSVLSVGRGVKDAQGKVERVEGYFVDLTEVRRDETQAEVDLALARIAQNRAVIDQAKGMLMLATGDDADEAFARLRHYSQHTNLKLHDIARRLVEAIGPRQGGEGVVPFLESLTTKSRLTRRLDQGASA